MNTQIVNVEAGAAGGWRWITFGDGSRDSVTSREIAARISDGQWTITERAAVVADAVTRELSV